MAKESAFQHDLIDRLSEVFPGCVVLKNDPLYLQGVPDLIVLYNDKWAMLECKKSAAASHRPNQDYYISKFGAMSYAAFVYPENQEEVIHELQQAFGTSG